MNQESENYSGSSRKNKHFEAQERENRMIVHAIASAIAKCGFYVCVCVMAGMLFSTCKVDKETIVQCEESCGDARGIDKVTAWSCTCSDQDMTVEASPWVLPKK